MRILYSFPHRLGAPGIGVTAVHQATGLARRGHEVWIYCASVAGSPPPGCGVTATMAVGGRRIPRRLVGFERALAYHDRVVARALRSSAARFDAVHCWGLASIRTLEAARQLGVHSFRESSNTHTAFSYRRAAGEAAMLGVKMPRGHSHRPRPRRLALEEREFEAAEVILAPSDYVRSTFLERGFAPEKVVRHRYGFDPDAFPAPDLSAPRRLGSPLRAVFVGLGEPRKGLHYALEAWRDAGLGAGSDFSIYGRMIPAYRRRLGPLLGQAGVRLRGFSTDVGAAMREADVLLLPSVEEGSALVTYEAQASGCVLLVSDAAGAFCSSDQALIHRAGDVAGLTEHLRLVDSDRSLLAALRAKTLARREELTWSAAADRLDAIYRRRDPH